MKNYPVFFVILIIHFTPWKINMEPEKWWFWKMIFLYNWVIVRFHVNLPGCKDPVINQASHLSRAQVMLRGFKRVNDSSSVGISLTTWNLRWIPKNDRHWKMYFLPNKAIFWVSMLNFEDVSHFSVFQRGGDLEKSALMAVFKGYWTTQWGTL